MNEALQTQIASILSNVNGWPDNSQLQSYARASIVSSVIWEILIAFFLVAFIVLFVKLFYNPYKKIKGHRIVTMFKTTTINTFQEYVMNCDISSGLLFLLVSFFILFLIIFGFTTSYLLGWIFEPNGMIIHDFLSHINA